MISVPPARRGTRDPTSPGADRAGRCGSTPGRYRPAFRRLKAGCITLMLRGPAQPKRAAGVRHGRGAGRAVRYAPTVPDGTTAVASRPPPEAIREVRASPSSSGPGLHPFKVATRVRIPLGAQHEHDKHHRPGHTPGPVAQLVSAPPCHGGGRGFESRRGRSTAPGQVAQLVEHTPEKRGVGSSILPLTTFTTGPDRRVLGRQASPRALRVSRWQPGR